MAETAKDLTLDQYIKRYAKTVKMLSMDDYFLSLYDYDKNGKIDRNTAESRAYNKLTGDDKQRLYTEYMDSVTKLNAYYKREAEKEWEAAHYFNSEDAEYSNVFGSSNSGAKTGAVERMENENRDLITKTGIKAANIAIFVVVGVVLLLIVKEMKKNETLILLAVGVLVLVVVMKQKETTQTQTGARGIWGGLVDAIGNTMERGNDSFTRMAQAIYEEKRQNKREDYERLRDTKDNSALFSNDILLY